MAWRVDLASGGGPGLATARAVDLDEEGNRYLAGTASVAPFGADLLVAKVDPEGAVVWRTTYGGAAGAFDEALAVAAQGGAVFAAGRADEGEGPYEGVLVCLDAATGDLEWSVPLEGLATYLHDPPRLALDGEGGVFVAGTVRDEGAGYRLVLTHFSSSGAVVWTRTRSAALADGLFSDGSGGVYVVAQGELARYGPTGEIVWTSPVPAFQATLAPGGGLRLLTSLEAGTVAIQGYTAEGGLEWEAPFDLSESGSTLGFPIAMAVDEAGNTFAVAGRYDSFPVGGFVLRSGPQGTGAWSATFEAEYLHAAFVAPDGAGGVYVGGTSSSIDPVIRGARFGPEGELLWTLERGSEAAPAYLGAIAGLKDGRLLVAATEGDATSPARVATTLTFDRQGALVGRSDVEGAPTSFDFVFDVTPTPGGGVYIAGITWTPGGGDDLLLARLLDDGTVPWAVALDDGGLERAVDVAVAPDGGAVVAAVAGEFECLYALVEPDDCDILVAAYGPDGEARWTRRWDGGGHDHPVGIVADGEGGAFVGGLSESTESGDADAVALRLDAAGGVLWEARYAGSDPEVATSEYPVAALAHASGASPGGVVLVGTDGYTPGGNGTGVFAVAFGPGGEALWEARYEGGGGEDLIRATAAAGTPSGQIYASGVVKRSSENGTAAVVFGPDGEEEWTGEVPFEALDIAVGPAGAAYLVGADAPWQPFPTSFATRLAPEGPSWTAEFGPGTGTAVAVDADGYAFVTGSLTRSLVETDAVLHVYGPEGDEVWDTELEAREANVGAGVRLMLSGDDAYVTLTEFASNLQGGYWGRFGYATVAVWKIDGSALPVGAEPEEALAPARLNIESISPNPVRGDATVALKLAEAEPIRAEAFDVLGRRVALLYDGPFSAGGHTLTFETGRLAAGLYVVRVEARSGATATRLVTVVK